MGTRFYRDPKPEELAVMAEFNRKVSVWLNKDHPLVEHTRNQLMPRVVTLDPSAKQVYAAFHDEVERQIGDGDVYEIVSGEGGKAAEMAVRLAVGLAVFLNPDVTKLNAAQMTWGVELSRYYLKEAFRIRQHYRGFKPQATESDTLADWLLNTWPEAYITPSDIAVYGPGSLRKSSAEARLEQLNALVVSGLLATHNQPVQIKDKTRRDNVFQVLRNETIAG